MRAPFAGTGTPLYEAAITSPPDFVDKTDNYKGCLAFFASFGLGQRLKAFSRKGRRVNAKDAKKNHRHH
jgi:hypothetical protein